MQGGIEVDRELSWGANYTPRRGWFHSWSNLDLAETRHDFAALKDLDLDHVRIFPLWPLLQPNRTLIDSAAIDNVLAVADAAGDAGLRVSVDLLQGHLSSFDFLPAWVSTWHRRNIFTDPLVVDGQKALARTLATELATRAHVLGLSLGNEIGQFAAPRHPETFHTTPEEAYAWNRDLLDTLTDAFPHGCHQHCFDDNLWFVDAHPFTPRAAVELGAETTIHSWVFGGLAQRFGNDSPKLPHFSRYLLEIADMWHRAFQVPADRTVWLQEIGAPSPWVSTERAPDFLEQSMRAAHGYANLSAVTWWCSHDVSRDLADFPELEYTLGLVDSEGNAKPAGERLREIIAADRRGEFTSQPTEATSPLVVEGLSLDATNRSLTGPDSDICAEWMTAACKGIYRRLELGS